MESSTPPRDTAWAMSEENVEIIRRMLDQGQARPEASWEVLEASWEILEEILDDDVQWEVSALGIAGLTTFHGADGVRQFYLRWVGAFEEWGYDTEELIDAGDSVVVRVHQWGRGKAVESPSTTAFGRSGLSARGR